MDLQEAQQVLTDFVSPYRGWRRAELLEIAGREITRFATGPSGAEYELELIVSIGPTRDRTISVSAMACEAGAPRRFKPRATVGFSVLEDGRVAYASGF